MSLDSPEFQVTPFRHTEVIFDADQNAVQRPPYGMWRSASDMAAAVADSTLRYIPGVGWELQHVETPASTSEADDAQGGTLRATTDLNVAPGMTEVTLHRSPTEFTGATDGATNLATTGDIYLQKSVSASGSFNTALSPDPMPDIPYPPSRTAMQTYKLDRVASSKDLHDPNAPLLFEFIYPGGLNGTAIFARIYFNGPPSTRGNWIGTGQYVLELRGDGSAWCYQYGKFVTSHASHWDIGVGLRWNSSSNPSAGKHSIEIRPYAVKDTDGGFLGGVISFFTGAGHAGGMLAKPLSQPTQKGIFSAQTQTGSDSNIFAVKARVDPSLTLGKSIPVQPGPITLELSRLARILAKIVALSYKPSGSLTDGAFSFEIPPTTDDDIWIYTRATLPAGTSLTVELKDSDGTSATLVESIPGQYHFHPGANGRRAYTVTITLATSDSRVTPILRGYSVRWDGKLTTVSPGAFWGNRSTATTLSMPDRLHSEFSITSGEDPSYETASFSIASKYAGTFRSSSPRRTILITSTVGPSSSLDTFREPLGQRGASRQERSIQQVTGANLRSVASESGSGFRTLSRLSGGISLETEAISTPIHLWSMSSGPSCNGPQARTSHVWMYRSPAIFP